MKILIVGTSKFDNDGITNVILNYYRAMNKSDMQIDFVVPNEIRKDLKEELESFGSHIYRIIRHTKNPLSYMVKLSKLIYKNKYNIIHAHGNSCTLVLEMYAAKIGGAKVRIPHSHSSSCKHIKIHRLFRKLFDNSYTNAFACGEKAGKWLYNGKPFIVVRNGIDVNLYSYNNNVREEYRNKLKLNGKKVVGHIGHFLYQKNHEFLIEIFDELYKMDNNYRLLLIGDGELRRNIEEQVNELNLGDAVVFLGRTTEVPQFLQAMDIVVLPSRFEGMPLTLVEAQAACLPCFASDAVSKEAKITDWIRFISLEKPPKEWAEQINSTPLINREEQKDIICEQIAKAGYDIVENAKKLKKMYRSFLS